MDCRKKPRKTPTASPITAARLAAGLTQSQLAALVGVAPQQIGAWERGERNPKTAALLSLASALKCPVEDLFP